MTVFVGTSGWQYRDWRGRFYPARLPQARWLEHYAARFEVVEINNTFYRLPPTETFSAWAARTPDDFRFVVKASRYLSHVRRLVDPADPVALLIERAAPLAASGKLGPVLLQLPPTLRAEPARLAETLAAFTFHGVRVAVEPRHETWFHDEVCGLLSDADAALVLTDRRNRVGPLVRTASWGYVRLHEGAASPRPCYGRAALRSWAERLASLYRRNDEVYVFTNNDPRGCAVRDARLLAHELAKLGFAVTRTPDADETPVETR